MLLGAKSRKTGFQLNKPCEKDKYSMENIDDYFNEEDNEHFNNGRIEKHESDDSKYFDRTDLSILSPSNIDSATSFNDIKLPSIGSTPVYNRHAFQVRSIPDISSFQSNYHIPETIEEDDEEKAEEEEDLIQRSVPDLLEDSEIEYITTEESVLLDTSQDALLEGEIESKNYSNIDYNANEEDSDYIPVKDGNYTRTESKVPLRRSTRIKVPTLDYWRNEKIVYKRRSARPELDISKIITYDNECSDDDDNNNKEKKRKKKDKITIVNESYNKRIFPFPMEKSLQRRKQTKLNPSRSNNNKSWDKVHNYEKKDTEWVSRGVFEGSIKKKSSIKGKLKFKKEILAVAPNFIDNERIYRQNDNNYKINILFDSQRNLFANGFMTIPVDGQKSQSTIDNIYIIFHVLQGCVEVTISKDNRFVCMEGSTFQIPSYNSYSLVNKGDIEVKLYFVQVTVK